MSALSPYLYTILYSGSIIIIIIFDRIFFSHRKALEQRDIKIPGLLELL